MRMIKNLIFLLCVLLMSYFAFNRLMISMVCTLFLCIAFLTATRASYKDVTRFFKISHLISTLIIVTLLFVFDNVFYQIENKSSVMYQTSIFAIFLAIGINVFVSFLIFFMKKPLMMYGVKNESFGDDLTHSDQIYINPASGLRMNNSIDSVGNVIGQNGNDHTDI